MTMRPKAYYDVFIVKLFHYSSLDLKRIPSKSIPVSSKDPKHLRTRRPREDTRMSHCIRQVRRKTTVPDQQVC